MGLRPASGWQTCVAGSGNARTLVLAVPALDFFMGVALNVAFENSGTLGLVEPNHLKDLSSIEPVVRAATHDGDRLDETFIHRHAGVCGLVDGALDGVLGRHGANGRRTRGGGGGGDGRGDGCG